MLHFLPSVLEWIVGGEAHAIVTADDARASTIGAKVGKLCHTVAACGALACSAAATRPGR